MGIRIICLAFFLLFQFSKAGLAQIIFEHSNCGRMNSETSQFIPCNVLVDIQRELGVQFNPSMTSAFLGGSLKSQKPQGKYQIMFDRPFDAFPDELSDKSSTQSVLREKIVRVLTLHVCSGRDTYHFLQSGGEIVIEVLAVRSDPADSSYDSIFIPIPYPSCKGFD